MSDRLLVRSMTHESEGVLSFELVDPDGADLPAWEPGAHLDLHLPAGLSRQYSLSGDPEDRTGYRLGVLREEAGRGGSAYVHDTLRPAPGRGRRAAQPLPARAGRGLRVRRRRHRDHADPADARRGDRGGRRLDAAVRRPHGLVDGVHRRVAVRRPGHALAAGQPRAARSRRPAPHPARGHARLLLRARSRCSTPSSSGWSAGRPGRCTWNGLPTPVVERDPADDGAVEVVLAESGRTLLVPPARSVLEVLLEEGVDVLHDCQEGICGSCEVKVIEGEVDHRDFVLSEPEKDANSCMMVCVSRGCGNRLVLGL